MDPNLPPNIKHNQTWEHDGVLYRRIQGVKPLWVCGYYDGIRSFTCSYEGHIYHAVRYTWHRDTPYWLYRYKSKWLTFLSHWMFLHYYAPQRSKWIDITLFRLSYKMPKLINSKSIGFWSLPKEMCKPLRDHMHDPIYSYLRNTNE